MQGGKSSQPVSLAAALFGWPAAPGHSAPDPVPDAWLLLFREQHAGPDPAVLSGIFRSCKSGRDWVLESAPKVHLTLDFTQQLPIPTRMQQLCTVLQALGTRGCQPTKLSVLCNNKCTTYGPFSALPHNLAGSTQCITELSVSAPDRSRPPELTICSAWLAGMAAVCPQLTTLTLDIPCYLPPPHTLPRLTHLSLTAPANREYPSPDSDDSDDDLEPVPDEETVKACAAVSALLPRITSLNLSFRYHKYDPFTPWERIFTAQHTTHTLTHLTTRDILDSELLGLLISHAPSLTDLTVGSMYVDTEDYKQRQWAVRRLHIKDFLLLESQGMEMLMRLPSSSAERLCVVVDGLELVSNSDEGLSSEFMLRALSWRFETPSLTLTPQHQLPNTDHPTALRNALRQLSDLQVCMLAQLKLNGWKWAAGEGSSVGEAVVSALPALPRGLKLGVRDISLFTDESLGAILRMGSMVVSLTVSSFALQSDQHANTPWPWEELKMTDFPVHMISKLPSLQGRESRPKVSYHQLHIHSDISQADVAALKAWLSNVDISRVYDCHRVIIEPPNANAFVETFTAQLSALDAVVTTLAPQKPKSATTIVLKEWPLNQRAVEALQGLPHGPVHSELHLDLSTCTWPLKPAQYKQLAKHVPDKYELWSVGQAPEAVVDSICAGLNECRAGKGLPKVKVVWLEHQEHEDRHVGECVVIGKWPWYM